MLVSHKLRKLTKNLLLNIILYPVILFRIKIQIIKNRLRKSLLRFQRHIQSYQILKLGQLMTGKNPVMLNLIVREDLEMNTNGKIQSLILILIISQIFPNTLRISETKILLRTLISPLLIVPNGFQNSLDLSTSKWLNKSLRRLLKISRKGT